MNEIPFTNLKIWKKCRTLRITAYLLINLKFSHRIYKSFILNNYFEFKLFSRWSKVHLYTVIVKLTQTHGCEVWILKQIKWNKNWCFNKNTNIENYLCPVYDNELRCLCRRRNKEIWELPGVPRITDFVKTQIIKWFRHVMRMSGSEYHKVAVEWKSTEKTWRGISRKAMDRWINAGLREFRNAIFGRKSEKHV